MSDGAPGGDTGANEAGSGEGGVPDASDAGANDASDGGAADDASDASLTFVTSPAPASAPLSGKVVDTNGAAIAGAAITATYVPDVDGGSADAGAPVAAYTGTDGTFTLDVATGRQIIAVSATGYVAWQQLEPVTSMTPALTVALFTASAPQSVAATGTTIVAGAASLAFPAGAYASATPVVATWIDRPHLASMSHRGWFTDGAGQVHHVLGELHVDVATEPAIPVAVTLPVPTGVTHVSYFPFDANGVLGAPIAPTTLAGGFATYAVPHFEGGDQTDDAPAMGADVVSGTCTYNDPVSGNPINASAGDFVPSGAAVQQGGSLVLDFSDGSLFTLTSPSFTFTDDGATGEMDENASGAGTAEVPHSTLAPGATRFLIRTPRMATLGVRGTVLSFSDHPCPDEVRALTYVEVAQGDVEVSSGSLETDVAAGHEAKACDGCANPLNPVCCDSTDCANGCCTADQQCLSGTTDDACGKNGATCSVCVAIDEVCLASQSCGISCPVGDECDGGNGSPCFVQGFGTEPGGICGGGCCSFQ